MAEKERFNAIRFKVLLKPQRVQVESGHNPDIPVSESQTDAIAKVSANPSSQFEDDSGDLLEYAMKDGVSQEAAQDEKSSDIGGNDDNEEPT